MCNSLTEGLYGGDRSTHLCGLTSELTGTQRHCAARRTLTSTPCGAMPLRVRVERPVSPHRPEAERIHTGTREGTFEDAYRRWPRRRGSQCQERWSLRQ